MRNMKGFTLIELVMVIVILGILAATALPKYVDLKGEAEMAAADGVLGSARAAATMNFADNLVNSTSAYLDTGAELLAAIDVGDMSCASGATTVTCTIGSNDYVLTISPVETSSAPATITKGW